MVNMGNVEFIQGQEQHTSTWGKYYIKGLEPWQAKENGWSDKHHSYTELVCNDVPEGTLFTIFEQSGNKCGPAEFFFSICRVEQSSIASDEPRYGKGYCRGNFRMLVRASGRTKGPRLMNWWKDGEKTEAFAAHCAKYINERGVKDLPPMPQPAFDEEVRDLMNAVNAIAAQLEPAARRSRLPKAKILTTLTVVEEMLKDCLTELEAQP